MRVAIFGATGRIGQHAAREAIASGHDVVLLIRSSSRAVPDEAETILGDVGNGADVRRSLRGVEGIIVALGARANRPEDADAIAEAMRTIVAAASDLGVRRIVTLSGAAVSVPGDRKPMIDRLIARFVRRLARHVVDAKQREYDVLRSSDLDWTALRPPLVGNGSAAGYRLDDQLQPGARVTRADVGQALVDQLDDATFFRRAPFVLPLRRGGSRQLPPSETR